MHKIYIYAGSHNDDGSDNDNGPDNDEPHNDRSDTKESDNSGLYSLPTGVVVIITNAATFILTLTATAIITFVVTYFCVKRRFVNANPQYQLPPKRCYMNKSIHPVTLLVRMIWSYNQIQPMVQVMK